MKTSTHRKKPKQHIKTRKYKHIHLTSNKTSNRRRTKHKIKPQDDYYLWANKEWISKIKRTLPASKKYMGQVDNFKLVQDTAYQQILEIIENETKTDAHMKHLYQSLISLPHDAAKKHVADFIAKHAALVSENNIWKLLACISKNEMVAWASPIIWELYPDEKNSNILTSHISYPNLSLYDYRLYINDSKLQSVRDVDPHFQMYKDKMIDEYLRYINKVFTACLGKGYRENYSITPENVYNVECDILTGISKYDDTYDIGDKWDALTLARIMNGGNVSNDGNVSNGGNSRTSKKKALTASYNAFSDKQGKSITGFNWREFAEHLGYAVENIPPHFVCTQVGYLKYMMEILKKEWASDKWKSYWFYIYFRQLIVFSERWRNIYYDFNDIIVRGRTAGFPHAYFPIIGLSYAYGKKLTNEYTKKYENKEYISQLTAIYNDIKTAYKERLMTNEWLSPKTRDGAMKKLEYLKLNIGECMYKMPDPYGIDYDEKDPWGNLCRISQWRINHIANHIDGKLNDDLERVDWALMKASGSLSYIVNAYYTASTNSVYIPTAYMMPPLVDDASRGYEYSLAHAGFTFGHEIGHALHVNGRTYDHNGNSYNWWADADENKYDRKITEINRQYETIAKRYGYKIDGFISLSENLADITGLSICEDCLDAYHNKNNVNEVARNMSFETFYMYYAIQNHQIMNKKENLVQSMTNPHLELRIRTNAPLMRMKRFKQLYNIKERDGMYWGSNDTVW